MRKIIFLLIGFSSLATSAQELQKNALSTSLLRLESNSQTMHGNFQLKLMNGVEYQRLFNKWSFGLKYEHGLNQIEEDPNYCNDCFYGTGYMREDNFYLTSNYSALHLFQSRLILNTGLSLYYSNLDFSGDYSGGWSGGGIAIDRTCNTLGFSPSLSLSYFPTKRLFVSVHSNIRFGWSQELNVLNGQTRNTNEWVQTAPDLRVGLKF